jgi:hypothetical protein
MTFEETIQLITNHPGDTFPIPKDQLIELLENANESREEIYTLIAYIDGIANVLHIGHAGSVTEAFTKAAAEFGKLAFNARKRKEFGERFEKLHQSIKPIIEKHGKR